MFLTNEELSTVAAALKAYSEEVLLNSIEAGAADERHKVWELRDKISTFFNSLPSSAQL